MVEDGVPDGPEGASAVAPAVAEIFVRRQEALVGLSGLALAGRTPDELLAHALALCARELGVRRASALELVAGGDRLVARADLGGGEEGPLIVEPGSDLDRALFGGEPVVVGGVRPGLTVAVPGSPRPFGAIRLPAPAAGRAGPLEVAFLQAVAAVVGAAVAPRAAPVAPAGGDQLAALVELAPDAVVVVGADGRILRTNTATDRLFGYERGELVGRNLETLLPARLRATHRRHRIDYLERPSARPMGTGLDLVGRRKDGSEVPVDISLSPVPGAKGQVMAAIRDMTERRRADAEASERREARFRRRQSLEINDHVVQGLATAAYALELGEPQVALAAVRRTLAAARRMSGSLLASGRPTRPPAPGDLVRAEPAQVLPRPPTLPPPDLGAIDRPIRVVVADDTADMRTILGVALSPANGFDVVGEAADGLEAIRLVERHRPDVVLLDLAMPVMDGLEAIPELRRRSPGTKICVLSGYGREDMAAAAVDQGADAYLEKGAGMGTLTEVVRSLYLQPAP